MHDCILSIAFNPVVAIAVHKAGPAEVLPFV